MYISFTSYLKEKIYVNRSNIYCLTRLKILKGKNLFIFINLLNSFKYTYIYMLD